MTLAQPVQLALEDFLQRSSLEESPAWEYVDGAAYQKPMPKAHHSRLQLKLAAAVNAVAEDEGIAAAFPELRCTFGGRSLVPDIAVLRWANIPFTETGELQAGAIERSPDWTIEILSPGQSSTKVIRNILFCLAQGSQLGWLIDPEERGIFVFQPKQELKLYRGDESLLVLEGIPLELTANQVFCWLQMGRS
ncbi:MAG: Uma2 family endonuclease [Cyanobacteria bacterium P01_G01_bin.54]